jgi:putative flavoprotein involved in K+ transport
MGADGEPVYERGVAPAAGLFYVGFPWLTRRGSGIINGVGADAALIAGHVAQRSEGAAGR